MSGVFPRRSGSTVSVIQYPGRRGESVLNDIKERRISSGVSSVLGITDFIVKKSRRKRNIPVPRRTILVCFAGKNLVNIWARQMPRPAVRRRNKTKEMEIAR